MRLFTNLKGMTVTTHDGKGGILNGYIWSIEDSSWLKNWPFFLHLGISWNDGGAGSVAFKEIEKEIDKTRHTTDLEGFIITKDGRRGTLTGELGLTEASCSLKNWPYLLKLGIIWADGSMGSVSFKDIGEEVKETDY